TPCSLHHGQDDAERTGRTYRARRGRNDLQAFLTKLSTGSASRHLVPAALERRLRWLLMSSSGALTVPLKLVQQSREIEPLRSSDEPRSGLARLRQQALRSPAASFDCSSKPASN